MKNQKIFKEEKLLRLGVNEIKRVFEHTDITQIHIYYTDNAEDLDDMWFYVPWSDDQYYNDKQTTELESEYIKVKIQ